MKKWISLLVLLLLPFVAGGIGSFFTDPVIPNWYENLNKPFFNPPNWIFGPVWTLLYLMMGVAAYLVWRKRKEVLNAKFSLVIFIVHLVFNASWSIAFFGMQNPGLAFGNIIILWGMILFLIIRFWKIDKVAAWLLVPYLFWVSFASLLNYAIWSLN